MAKKVTFTMSVIYDEDEIYGNSALSAIEHAMFNIEGIYEWESEEHDIEDVEYDFDEE